jgi:putative transcriptional regulator
MDQSELAPGFLLAAPNLRDPNFNKTVVLLGRHDDEGALGWVINGRALGPAVELFKTSGLFAEGTVFPDVASFRRIASVGGPVAPQTGWLLFRSGMHEVDGQLDLGGGLAVTGEASAFTAFVESAMSNGGGTEFRLVLGCAGWAPGQLEAEISSGAWLPAPLDVDLLFEHDGDAAWDEAYHRTIGAAPATFSGRPGKA